MPEQNSDKQHEAILTLLDEAMAILREGKTFNPEDPIFGKVSSIEAVADNVKRAYDYDNNTIPPSDLGMTTEADPLNYSDNRSAVPVVPSHFFLRFYEPVQGFTWTEIQKRLDLADYWVYTNGGKQEGKCFPASPPNEWITICRYRANERIGSRFPVDVELSFLGPRKNGNYDFDSITIDRAYPYLTPEMRKQKREEREQRARDLYGNPGTTP